MKYLPIILYSKEIAEHVVLMKFHKYLHEKLTSNKSCIVESVAENRRNFHMQINVHEINKRKRRKSAEIMISQELKVSLLQLRNSIVQLIVIVIIIIEKM